MSKSKKEEALEYFNQLQKELESLGLDPETSELYKFTQNTINRARELTKTLPVQLLEMIK